MSNSASIDQIGQGDALIGACRLCEGALRERFSIRLLEKYDVAYLQCERCGSLQSQSPFWLEEAYAASNLSHLDTGAAQRNLNNLGATWLVARLLGISRVYDVGGGDGLLCRLLRDYGLNCFLSDRYARNAYAQGFEQVAPVPGGLVTAFEVVEHYARPQDDLTELLGRDAEAVLISTGIYSGQGSDWWYLTPESGQHIFFYTQAAFRLAAERFGYEVGFQGNFILFTRAGRAAGWRRRLARAVLHPLAVRLARAIVLAMPAGGVKRDTSLFAESP